MIHIPSVLYSRLLKSAAVCPCHVKTRDGFHILGGPSELTALNKVQELKSNYCLPKGDVMKSSTRAMASSPCCENRWSAPSTVRSVWCCMCSANLCASFTGIVRSAVPCTVSTWLCWRLAAAAAMSIESRCCISCRQARRLAAQL